MEVDLEQQVAQEAVAAYDRSIDAYPAFAVALYIRAVLEKSEDVERAVAGLRLDPAMSEITAPTYE